mgnify:CR=1 FL=1
MLERQCHNNHFQEPCTRVYLTHVYPHPHNPVQPYGLLAPHPYMDANRASRAMIVSHMRFELVTPLTNVIDTLLPNQNII